MVTDQPHTLRLNKDKDWLLEGEPAYFKTGHI